MQLTNIEKLLHFLETNGPLCDTTAIVEEGDSRYYYEIDAPLLENAIKDVEKLVKARYETTKALEKLITLLDMPSKDLNGTNAHLDSTNND